MCHGNAPRIHALARRGDTAALIVAITNGADVQEPANNVTTSPTALHQAAEGGHSSTALALLAHGAKVNAAGETGWTPLHAASRADAATTSVLIEHGAIVNKKDNTGWSPLYTAAVQGNTAALGVLLANGACPETRTDEGSTALHGCDEDGAEVLLAYGALIDAADSDGLTALHCAAMRGQRRKVAVLLNAGANLHALSASQETPLHFAVCWDHVSAKMVSLLLSHGANVAAADVNARTPLHHVAVTQGVEKARLLLRHGADVNTADNFGATALHRGATSGSLEMAELLLHYGADMELRDTEGRVPLHHAAAAQRTGALALLLEMGAGVDEEDAGGRTPTAYAQGNADATQVLSDYI